MDGRFALGPDPAQVETRRSPDEGVRHGLPRRTRDVPQLLGIGGPADPATVTAQEGTRRLVEEVIAEPPPSLRGERQRPAVG
ncbi:hypothetical protein GCM10023196_017030 [Actinoallomurus vinaceus]|uniref:Uncharacterized protein n=1 Tax=Actinoallomurus vinaceus TaxID=1080074 RepID=A0ABP8U3A2_9ACTN